MAVRVIRLGTDRLDGEGLRIGTVRRPPRGVKKADIGKLNWYDTWLPNVSPSPDTMKMGQAVTTDKEWSAFERVYRKEMSAPEAKRVIELLAAMSHSSDFSVGCYCENETRCHRSILRALLQESGASME
ncbi:DUF488 domain-containing protein [Pseudoteredinibacter isoporae]|uniref:Uncharacterized protein YeaO (DUF488 family) n=1 Tax=Pseudoteredinibacter isoporae TaxID=570281 RepID=A0A7X0JW84_9GAMM|nr:DUF488 family protein [Pseudoteredinibacter isoporae]MBB6522655.1 uncharacterized protein YeaO (DUF488 family) [Pseudoteredinibacter isoporae]NHO88186.1 DUF488 family protein [Pseudoteredinibacter isoporae]NIB23483.1 DUF488 family protein [Pseudoteredinibacter isoporae]